MKKIIYALCVCAALYSASCKKSTTTTTDPVPSSVTDIDGNVYEVIKIGNQYWTTSNLRTSKYNDGTPIATGLNSSDWSSATTGAYALYNSDPLNDITYGKLYNWHAVNTGKLAPAGFHVPSSTEWATLVNALGGSNTAGGTLKSTSTLWNAPNTGANNSSGFNALPAGFRGTGGGYSSLGDLTYFWGSDERNSSQGEYLSLSRNMANSAMNGATKTFGYSVRLVKD
jgi:uncharacterized protein (TIGR02145 family)